MIGSVTFKYSTLFFDHNNKKISNKNNKKHKKGGQMGMFLDYDKCENVFYSNLYLDDYKLVVKTPIVRSGIKPETPDVNNIKLEEFSLVDYVYLLAHE